MHDVLGMDVVSRLLTGIATFLLLRYPGPMMAEIFMPEAAALSNVPTLVGLEITIQCKLCAPIYCKDVPLYLGLVDRA